MTRSILLLSAALLLAARCEPDPVVPDPVVDAGADPVLPDVGADPIADCQAAHETLARLGCRAADGSSLAYGPTGETFAHACVMAYAGGVDYHAGCIATATDCSQVDSAAQGLLCLEAGAP